MKQRLLCAAILWFCAGQAAFADLTMRHTIDFTFGSFLPPSMQNAMKAQLAEVPKELTVQIKGEKIYTSMGRMVMVADYSKGVITLLDPKGRRFATCPIADYPGKIASAQKLPEMPPQMRQMFENLKLDVKSDRTGKEEVIQGIHGEENLVTISVEFPGPSGPAIQIRMEMHIWIAGADEVKRVPALKELEVYARMRKTGLDPMELMTKSMTSFPGMADKIRGPMEELAKNGSSGMLRMKMAMYMPAMAQLAGGAADQPFTEYTMELAELSSAPVPDSRFEIPADYQSAPMEDLIAILLPAPKPAAPSGPPQAETPPREQVRRVPAGPPPAGVFRVGGGVTAPQVLSKTEPSYTEEARAARIQGSVLLYVVVGPDGAPQQMRVLRSLDPGLDQKAIETVGTWKFKPGTKDGNPVAVEAQIEVNFRLME